LTDFWSVRSGYSFLQIDLQRDRSSDDPSTARTAQESSPHNQVFVHSRLDLPWKISLDSDVRYVDNLPAQDVPNYVTFDIRGAWSPMPWLELSLVGQNLAEKHQREFSGGTQVERAMYGQVRIQW
jgi:iron complex outermembrane receptor protein